MVDELASATEFFVGVRIRDAGQGLLEGRGVDRVVGLKVARADIVILQFRTATGRLQVRKLHSSNHGDNRDASANTISATSHSSRGIDALVACLRARTRRRAGNRCAVASGFPNSEERDHNRPPPSNAKRVVVKTSQ
jgi:hypothetical protein